MKKKHNSISFHKIREAVAAGYIEIHKIRPEDNVYSDDRRKGHHYPCHITLAAYHEGY